MEAYVEKQNCIKEQYSKFAEPTTKLFLNGANTLGENIADNGEFVVLISCADLRNLLICLGLYFTN